ncbi:hypothetical protein BGX31_004140 [Mortierella sp. GBA43]|nr:hypothetical protein BGX31_004140 [Mortierella sp. GBA43]
MKPISTTTAKEPTTKTGSMGSKFGPRLFSKGTSHSRFVSESLNEEHERIAQTQEQLQGDATVNKKRMSGGFLASTFRSKQPQSQSGATPATSAEGVLPQVQTKAQPSPQSRPLSCPSSPLLTPTSPPLKKRKSLIPKLPKLDTRPNFLASSSKSKKGKELDSQHQQQHQRPSGDDRPTKAKGPNTLLPSFHLLRPSSRSALRATHDTNPSLPNVTNDHRHHDPDSQAAQQRLSRAELESEEANKAANNNSIHRIKNVLSWENWAIRSQKYHDERWDRASVFTTDSELRRLNEDPNYPGYPDRNEYWQKHCTVRERHARPSLETDTMFGPESSDVGAKGSRLQSRGSMPNMETERFGDGSTSHLKVGLPDGQEQESNGEQVVLPDEQLKEMRNRLRSPDEREVSRRFPPQRVRFKTYSAYMLDMQQKSKEHTELCLSPDVTSKGDLPEKPERPSSSQFKVSEKLIQGVRALHRKSLSQKSFEAFFQRSKSLFMNKEPQEQVEQQHLHQDRRRSSTYVGTSGIIGNSDDDESDDQRVPFSPTTRRQRQLESGILFVPSTTTSATVSVTKSLDFKSQLKKKPLSPEGSPTADGSTSPNKTSTTINILGHESDNTMLDVVDESVRCLVASYFDKRLCEESIESTDRNSDGGCGDTGAGDGARAEGNGFMMLQQSFSSQGSPDAFDDPIHPTVAPENSNFNIDHEKSINGGRGTSHSPSPRSPSPKYDDHCLCQPGQYAAHNHIMPLQQLIELQEQDYWRAFKSEELSPLCPLPIHPLSTAATGATKTEAFETIPTERRRFSPDILDTPPRSSYREQESNGPTQSESNNGHMLLMVVQGRMQYYEKGSRKNGIIWDDDGEMVYDDGKSVMLHENEAIEEEGEERGSEGEDEDEVVGEEEDLQLQHQQQQMQNRPAYRRGHSKSLSRVGDRRFSWFFNSWTSSAEANQDDMNSPRLGQDLASSADFTMTRRRASTLTLVSAQPAMENTNRSGRRNSTCSGMSISTTTTNASGSTFASRQYARSIQFNKMSSLGQMRGAKARASVSKSVAPTLITPSALYGSSSSTSSLPLLAPTDPSGDMEADSSLPSTLQAEGS